ncbi:MAG: LacI family DNA-binding transcriptional regulator, partial [Verrucomicrobiota bacterium]
MSIRVTIRDIAEKANVHHTTVSLALRNSPRLLEKTKSKIKKIAKELGYIPDPMLSSLVAYRQGIRRPNYQSTIAWINNWPTREEPYSYFFGYHEGANQRAQELGYQLEEFWLHEKGLSTKHLYKIFKSRNIQGLLMLPQPEAPTSLDFDFSEFSVINFGYSYQPALFHVVTNHHVQSFSLAFKKLRELGYKRIGFYEHSDLNARCNNALLSELLIQKREKSSIHLISPLLTPQVKFPEFIPWIEKEKPDAIITYTGHLQNLKLAGYNIPKDIGFASFHLGSMKTSVSGVCQNDEMIGRWA